LEFARRQCGKKLYYGSLKELYKLGETEEYHLIYLHHVCEHMNDPISFLEIAKQCLASQGRIVIIVPDVSRIDQFPNPGGDLLPFLHIAHKFNFSMPRLARLCGRARFRIPVLRPDDQLETSFTGPELWIELSVDETLVTSDDGALDRKLRPESPR
jgi:hypothetical protein